MSSGDGGSERPPAPVQEGLGFCGVPYAASAEGSSAAVLGAPDEARSAAEIRRASMALSGWNQNLHVDVPARLSAVDLGDVRGGREPLILAGAIEQVMRDGAVPLVLGGGGALGLQATLAAAGRAHQVFGLVRFDAHSARGWARRAGEEPELAVDPVRTVWAGVRSASAPGSDTTPWPGQELDELSLEELVALELPGFSARLHEVIGAVPCVVSVDLDFVDAAAAPAAADPVVGGPTSREALALVRAAAGLRFCALECAGLDPRLDPSGITALLAATIGFELLTLLALQR